MKSAPVRRRAAVWPLVFAFLTACSSWRVVGPTPAEYLQNQRPGEIQVTRTDSSRVKLRAPALLGDTLVGTVGGGLARGDTAHQISISLRDVRSVEVRRFSFGKTFGLFMGVGVVATVICAAGDQPGPGC